MLLEATTRQPDFVSFDATALSLDHARGTAISGLLDFWSRHARDGDIPRKSDFLPEQHAPIIGFMNILEVWDKPDDFIFRLMGSRIAQALGADFTGKSVSQVRPLELAHLLRAHLLEAARRAEPTLYRVMARREEQLISYLRIIVPLSRFGEGVGFLLTGSVCHGEASRRAQRLM